MQLFLRDFATALLIGAYVQLATAETTLTTRDWNRLGKLAGERHIPVVMVVTGEGCGHCERMEREFLSDPNIQSFLGERTIVGMYHESTGGKVTDFDGERLRARMFLKRYEIFATPTLLFLDAQGRPIADPLVGYTDVLNYQDMVTGRLDEAQLALEAGSGVGPSAVATITEP